MNALKTVLAATLLASASLAAAQPTVTLHSSNVGINPNPSAFYFSFNNSAKRISINQTWTGNGMGVMSFSGLALGTVYEINISAFNSSGAAWSRIALELLDPAGNPNDTLDPSPQPAFVPVGFSTSNNSDGLSFAQGSTRPRFSYEFSKALADELSDQRDFLDFYDGTVLSGRQAWLQFSLVNNSAENMPFLLVQRPNAFSATVVPVPAAAPLLASGLATFGLIARRRKQAA
jgi:hypothetical protein